MSAYMIINSDYAFRAKKRDFTSQHPWCARCGRYVKARARTVDHIIPMSIFTGSPESVSNWQMLCDPCHKHKTAKTDNKIFENNLRFAFINAKSLNMKGSACQV